MNYMCCSTVNYFWAMWQRKLLIIGMKNSATTSFNPAEHAGVFDIRLITSCHYHYRGLSRSRMALWSPPASLQHSGVRESQHRASLRPWEGTIPHPKRQTARGTGIGLWDSDKREEQSWGSATKPPRAAQMSRLLPDQIPEAQLIAL